VLLVAVIIGGFEVGGATYQFVEAISGYRFGAGYTWRDGIAMVLILLTCADSLLLVAGWNDVVSEARPRSSPWC